MSVWEGVDLDPSEVVINGTRYIEEEALVAAGEELDSLRKDIALWASETFDHEIARRMTKRISN